MKSYFFCLLMCLILFSCKPTEREQLVEEKIKMINSNMEEWNELTEKRLKTDFVKNKRGYASSYIEQLDLALQEELESKGIISIDVRWENCTYVQYYYERYSFGMVSISWEACDAEHSKKGVNKQRMLIETWGIGNGWSILVDSDWI